MEFLKDRVIAAGFFYYGSPFTGKMNRPPKVRPKNLTIGGRFTQDNGLFDLKCPGAVPENGNGLSILCDSIDGKVIASDHKVGVADAVIEAFFEELFFAQILEAFHALIESGA